ncbi:LysR family transcriptional regulator [Oceanibaculum pacificum]|uniref:LysR family transcriptional regulator n=1 Tax=Oceanibaculum pacificum TaxID=580166 RepID=A0A154VYC2_9PROT|nr:LysR substrate-binding domain-containing protein [Oceanibaculum pacificum]KZD06342.1 LysR family transcriptional regulator [Oceanibaculum pacificum]
MELSWLDDFQALVETGNFNRAAEARLLTQPAFSRRIRALEDWIGAPLFDRSTHRIGLTPAGAAFRPLAEDIARRLAHSREAVRQAAGAAATTLKFAATHALSLTFFPTWLRALEEKGHVGPIQLTSDTMRGCEQAMRQGEAQFLLCHHHPAVPTPLEATHFRSVAVGRDRLLPVSLPGRHIMPGTADAPLPLLSYTPESALGWIVQAALSGREDRPHLETVFTAHLATVLLAMVRDGRGIAWLPRSLIERELESGSLARAGDEAWDVEVDIHLFRTRARLGPAAEAFWAALES